MDLISTIHLVVPQKTRSLPLIQSNLLTLHIKVSSSFLATFWLSLNIRLLEGKGDLGPNLGIIFYSSVLWRQDQVEDQDHNESSTTYPRTGIKMRFVLEFGHDFLL